MGKELTVKGTNGARENAQMKKPPARCARGGGLHLQSCFLKELVIARVFCKSVEYYQKYLPLL